MHLYHRADAQRKTLHAYDKQGNKDTAHSEGHASEGRHEHVETTDKGIEMKAMRWYGPNIRE